MRLDKFLKVSRLVKRRTVADDLCSAGRVQLNGRPAKSGTKVAIGDEITIGFGQGQPRVKVLDIKDSVRKQDAANLYEVLPSKTDEAEEAE